MKIASRWAGSPQALRFHTACAVNVQTWLDCNERPAGSFFQIYAELLRHVSPRIELMNSDPKSYKFMKETIKKEPPDRKKWLLRCLLFFCAAVIFGLIAALTLCSGGTQDFCSSERTGTGGYSC